MTKQLTNPVTDYRLSLLGSFGTGIRGWIELLNGDQAAGYIYLSYQDPLPPDSLSFNGTYIVMHQPASLLSTLLDILRRERSLSIRFYDPESPGIVPATFLETPGTRIGEAEHPMLPKT